MQSTGLFARVVGAIVIVCMLGSLPVFATSVSATSEPNLETTFVLNQFRNKTLQDFVRLMNRLRPQAVTPEEKTLLRKDGFALVNARTEITDSARLADLYRQTREVFEFHRRAGIVEYILFKNNAPVVETKAGAFIAVSNRLWDVAENKDARSGIIAHELSHEYFAMQFFAAYQAHNCEKLRVIELLCDVLATVTLISLNMDPDKYAAALARIVHSSKEAETLNDGHQSMPSLQARLYLISEIKRQFSHQAKAENKKR